MTSSHRPFATRFAALLAGLALLLALDAAGPAAAADSCRALARELASVAAPKAGKSARYGAAAARQQDALDRTLAQARARGCGGLFGGGSGCAALADTIARQRANLAELKSVAGPSVADRRRTIQARMAALGCGAAPAARDGDAAGAGATVTPVIVTPYKPAGGLGVPRGSLRTLCVRTCDGYYFPLSWATSRARLGAEEALCRAQCPGAAVELFVHPTGSEVQAAVSLTGRRYRDQSYAFRHTRELVDGCGCRPVERAALGDNASLRLTLPLSPVATP